MAARDGMTNLIQRVRDLAAAGVADYTVGISIYWDDDQVQNALDRNRADIVDEPLSPIATVNTSGIAEYLHYESKYQALEETDGGTAVFYLRNAGGSLVGTADYTPDYNTGRFTFAASTGGSTLYLNGRTYDVYAAAADIWRQKAAHVADRFDFSADGASFKASQLVAQYERMAQQCERRASFGAASGVRAVTMYRDDVTVWAS